MKKKHKNRVKRQKIDNTHFLLCLIKNWRKFNHLQLKLRNLNGWSKKYKLPLFLSARYLLRQNFSLFARVILKICASEDESNEWCTFMWRLLHWICHMRNFFARFYRQISLKFSKFIRHHRVNFDAYLKDIISSNFP